MMGYCKSGKGTHGRRIQGHYGTPIFDMGHELKEAQKRDPKNPVFNPINEGKPVSSATVVRIFKRWVIKHNTSGGGNIILDGIPRLPNQMEIIEFLKERGFKIMVFWFTTDPDICDARPPRPGRFEDTDENTIRNRRAIYGETLKLKGPFADHGISEKLGNMFCLDNSGETEEETFAKICGHIDSFLSRLKTFEDMPLSLTAVQQHQVHAPMTPQPAMA